MSIKSSDKLKVLKEKDKESFNMLKEPKPAKTIKNMQQDINNLQTLEKSIKINRYIIYTFAGLLVAVFCFIGYLMYRVLSYDNTLRQTLYLGSGSSNDSTLKANQTEYRELYIYSTQQEDIYLNKVSGNFRIQLSTNSGVKFQVKDNNGTVIGSEDPPNQDNSKQVVIVPFNSVNTPSTISLCYQSPSTTIYVHRIDIEFRKY